MIDEADVAETVAADMRRAFYLGLCLGLMFGFWTTLLGMGLGWAVWRRWLAERSARRDERSAHTR